MQPERIHDGVLKSRAICGATPASSFRSFCGICVKVKHDLEVAEDMGVVCLPRRSVTLEARGQRHRGARL